MPVWFCLAFMSGENKRIFTQPVSS